MNFAWRRLPTYLIVALISIAFVLPFLWMFMSALKTTPEIFQNPFGLPREVQWGNLVQAWENGIAAYFLNSVLVTVISVAAIILVSGSAAYALARLQLPGRTGLYLAFITGYAVPTATVLVPLYELLRSVGLLNTYPGLILPYIAFAVPFSIILLYAFFLDFPTELEEAAHLDGANTFQVLWFIVAPLSLPAVLSLAIVQSISIWNEYLLALLIISEQSLMTLPLGLSAFRSEYSVNWSVMLAALSIATIPMLVLFWTFQRQFINSLTGFSK